MPYSRKTDQFCSKSPPVLYCIVTYVLNSARNSTRILVSFLLANIETRKYALSYACWPKTGDLQ